MCIDRHANFSLFRMVLVMGFSYIDINTLRYILSSLTFSRTHIIKVCWILSEAFSPLILMIKCFLTLKPFLYFITYIDFCMLKYLHLQDRANLSMVHNVLIYVYSLCKYFTEDFWIYDYPEYRSVVFLYTVVNLYPSLILSLPAFSSYSDISFLA